ncbi:MAG: four-carbon acid sugar kinase family protein [Hyphomicrobiales bacterium]|nr:four-carbon acid sugar kinase family protein [Hyphomicrobiales bacterium]
MILGCIADDLTGATDLALMLSREGLRTLQSTGVPHHSMDLGSTDAVVIALKSRTISVHDAVTLSLAASDWLKAHGAKHFLFKYCSTFDSTDQGNIGPVADALLDHLKSDFTLACPAFPATGRSIYMGQLFVNGVPLAESPMRDHPLTPMRDSDLRRVLQKQSKSKIGHVAFADVNQGADAIASAFEREKQSGHRIVIVDAITNDHLREIGRAAASLPLITGGSGIAIGLPKAYLDRGLIKALHPPSSRMVASHGRRIILAGSCSVATRGQIVDAIEKGLPHFRVDPFAIADGSCTIETVMKWVASLPVDALPLIYSSDDPDHVAKVQAQLGREKSGALVEHLMADLARALVDEGFTRMIVAGGETSGAVVEALGVGLLEIGPEIDPGVPWTKSRSGPEVALALKSGNFGAPDFFTKAWDRLS